MSARLLSLQLGAAEDIAATGSAEWWDKQWRTGFHKQPQDGPRWLGREGLRGDECADLRVHGGADKAVCVYPSEHLPYWRATLARPELSPGAFGENFSTAGMLENDVCIGDTFRVGAATVQITQPRQPCWKLARRWRVKDLAVQVEQTGRTGWYFRVLTEGEVEAPADLQLLQRPHPQWTIAPRTA